MTRTLRAVVGQNVRDFTVEIRNYVTEEMVGTGIAIYPDGNIVTCKHVFDAAESEDMVLVRFPSAKDRRKKEQRARLRACCEKGFRDDVVLLDVVNGVHPLSMDQLARLGSPKFSEDMPFKAYGYRRLEKYDGLLASGVIQGSIEPPREGSYLCDPLQLSSSQINQGMSGAGVLDKENNLVVGIVSETWFPNESTKDRDTAWAVDSSVLSCKPFNLSIREEPLPFKETTGPRPPLGLEIESVSPVFEQGLRNASPLVPEVDWVARPEIAAQINADWDDSNCLVTGLIGFGGEGKSSLVRHWLETILHDQLRIPDNVFWWDFQVNSNTDIFIGELISYLGGERLAQNMPTTATRVELVGSLLQEPRRFLFVLDGLESVQFDQGDKWGMVQDASLLRLLELMASPGHQSLTVLTSRLQVTDLIAFSTYQEHEVQRLTHEQALSLLEKQGVCGPEQRLAALVESWGGHALSLSLLAGYIGEQDGGDLSVFDDLPSPFEKKTTQGGDIDSLMKYYERKLSYAERVFLGMASVLRGILEKNHFEYFFKAEHDILTLNLPLVAMDDDEFAGMITRLVRLRILQCDPFFEEYRLQPLIRTYYNINMGDVDRQNIFLVLAEFSLSEADAAWKVASYMEEELGIPALGLWSRGAKMRIGEESYSIDWRGALIDTVHYFCGARAFDRAYDCYQGLQEGGEWALVKQFGAFATDLHILQAFFPDGDFEKLPLIDSPVDQCRLVNQVGYDLMQLGKLDDALHIFKRAVRLAGNIGALESVFNSSLNVIQLLIQAGTLRAAQKAVSELEVLRPMIHNDETDPRFYLITTLTYRAWIFHLQGKVNDAASLFEQAVVLQDEREEPGAPYLYGPAGQYYVSHLIDVGDLNQAENLVIYNLELCNIGGKSWALYYPVFLRLQGDIARLKNDFITARERYNEALNACRTMRLQYELVYVLLGSGLLASVENDLSLAHEYLQDALVLSKESGFSLLEAKVRLALSIAHDAS